MVKKMSNKLKQKGGKGGEEGETPTLERLALKGAMGDLPAGQSIEGKDAGSERAIGDLPAGQSIEGEGEDAGSEGEDAGSERAIGDIGDNPAPLLGDASKNPAFTKFGLGGKKSNKMGCYGGKRRSSKKSKKMGDKRRGSKKSRKMGGKRRRSSKKSKK
jgi:hypothetical protein